LSIANKLVDGIKTRKIAILAADGVDDAAVTAMQKALKAAGAQSKIVAPRGGNLKSAAGTTIPIDFSLLTTSSVMFDAVFIPGTAKSVAVLISDADAQHFINEAFKHCKTIAASGEGCQLIERFVVGTTEKDNDPGLIVSSDVVTREMTAEFVNAIASHRHWGREMRALKIPA